MLAHALFFYFFSIIAIISAIFVIVSRNTVHAVFFLILDFISIACLFIMIGAEFLGMMMLIVYVGAVAVLFLFVVMLMNVTEQKLSWFRGTKKTGHIPIGLIVGSVILLELIVIVGGWKYRNTFSETKFLSFNSDFTNTHMIGNVMYTEYIHLFQISGMILLISMIGAIVLTLRKRPDVKRQDVLNQIFRDPKSSIDIKDIKPNAGA
mgnify:CR=1 FL=1